MTTENNIVTKKRKLSLSSQSLTINQFLGGTSEVTLNSATLYSKIGKTHNEVVLHSVSSTTSNLLTDNFKDDNTEFQSNIVGIYLTDLNGQEEIPVSDLSEDVVIKIKAHTNVSVDTSVQCVFWNGGTWSTTGVETKSTIDSDGY